MISDTEYDVGPDEDLVDTGCEESRLTVNRRHALGISASLFSWAFMPKIASAANADDPRLLIVVLRGGMDGISVAVPYGDTAYHAARDNISFTADQLIRRDGFFGLHPALVNFSAMMSASQATLIHAVGLPVQNRSHFDCQDNLESGLPGVQREPTGWVNRMLAALPAGSPIKARSAVHIGRPPLIVNGSEPVIGWSLPLYDSIPNAVNTALASIYAEQIPFLGDRLQNGLAVGDLASSALAGVAFSTMSTLGRGFAGAAGLMTHAEGPRVAVLSVDGWDTHSNQGTVAGPLADRLKLLDGCLGDFKNRMGTLWSKTVVMCVTEFGRTVRTNGTFGTDHGVGTVALLCGGAVSGGSIRTNWPGLATSNLVDGRDLEVTTDMRSIFKGVLRDHLGLGATALNDVIFPGSATSAPAMNGLVR